MIILLLIPVVIIIIIFKFLSTEPKSEHQKFLERELEDNPDYIDWLRTANGGKDYKLGIKILEKIRSEQDNSYKRWFKKVRRLGKW